MVTVAEWLRHQIVVLVNVGSNPIGHPIYYGSVLAFDSMFWQVCKHGEKCRYHLLKLYGEQIKWRNNLRSCCLI